MSWAILSERTDQINTALFGTDADENYRNRKGNGKGRKANRLGTDEILNWLNQARTG